ncbi:MAG TPA: SDR family oxidoreductase [Acidimicrobiia bacterium]|nr:SDR family oxidoreductase [Acidimicrobiia bacterium]
MRLLGKKIVVTGASGIAAAGARAATREGAVVFLISLDLEECRDLSSEIGGSAFAVADLSEEEQAEEAFESARSTLGGIDGLFAVAGGSGRRYGDGPLDEMSLEAWESTIRINGRPALVATREAVRSMRDRGGSVVLVSSVLATSPSPSHFSTHAYAAAKGALNSLTVSIAAYYARDGIRVNAIAPGLVDTPMSARAASDPKIVDYARRKQPLAAGLIAPDDVAGTAVFLLSDESAMLTGQVIAVDGGWSVTEA